MNSFQTFFLCFFCSFLVLLSLGEDPPPFIKCYTCKFDYDGFKKGGNCFEVDETTEVADNCYHCDVYSSYEDGKFGVFRRCGQVTVKGATSICKFDPKDENYKGCVCNADLCNALAVQRPDNIIDCYKCNGRYNSTKPNEKSCFEVDDKTPTEKDCLMCHTQVMQFVTPEIWRGCETVTADTQNGCHNKDLEYIHEENCYCTTAECNKDTRDPKKYMAVTDTPESTTKGIGAMSQFGLISTLFVAFSTTLCHAFS